MAAAWVTLATEVLVTTMTLSAVLRRLELSLRPRRILLAAVAAALMTGAVAALQALGAGLGVLLAAAAVTYPAAVLLVGAVRLEEVRELLQLRGGGKDTGPA